MASNDKSGAGGKRTNEWKEVCIRGVASVPTVSTSMTVTERKVELTELPSIIDFNQGNVSDIKIVEAKKQCLPITEKATLITLVSRPTSEESLGSCVGVTQKVDLSSVNPSIVPVDSSIKVSFFCIQGHFCFTITVYIYT